MGVSIGRHISNAYHWLASNFKRGDQIYIYGFSRGAFTARSLAGLLKLGLIDFSTLDQTQRWEATHNIYRLYKSPSISIPQYEFLLDGAPVKVRFIGVWDTVGALGIPDDLEILNLADDPKDWRFHDTELGEHIQAARHAMALDEKRSSFTVTRWANTASHNDAKEVWFPGVHSDVGGGYANTDLSDIALKWMIEESINNGLTVKDVFSQLTPNPLGVLHNSYKGVFSLLRSRPRNVHCVNKQQNSSVFHESVFERQSVSPITASPYWPTKSLEINKPFYVDVFAKKHWNFTSIYMKKGEKYAFNATGEWVDKNDRCDWRGTQNDDFTVGDIVRAGSSLFGKLENLWKRYTDNPSTDFWGTKRVEEFNWFIAVGCVANDGDANGNVSNDGSPDPHEYIDLPDYSNGNEYTVKKDGYFYVFANDVWAFYSNNRGAITLEITKTSDN